MNSLTVSPAISGGESCSYVSGSKIHLRRDFLGTDVTDLQRSPFRGTNGVMFKHLAQPGGRAGGSLRIVAKVKKGQNHEYPWPDDIDPNWQSSHLNYLSHFKPLADKPKPVTLAFEKPLVDLEKKIIDVRKMADETGLDFSDQINSLESKYQQALKDLYTHLTPMQRLTIARHPNRPTFLDHIFNITDKWIELHGDRAGYDDPAIVSGLGSIDGKTYMFIGHQKGRNTKENIERNFGMPTPHGYRKALRMMKYADQHRFPIITFIDTPGAFADLKSEELGQGEAIAHNLRDMFGLKVPIVTVVIGEGGSGGALAIGCSNKMYMMENSVFYVASPEACAAILWKSSQAAPKAAEKLKITSGELLKLQIADGIIPEPLGGAHTDPTWTSQQIKLTVMKTMEELSAMDVDSMLAQRHHKFRVIGKFIEGEPVDPEIKINMKKKETDISLVTADIEEEIQHLKHEAIKAKGENPAHTISDEAVEALREEVDKEMTNAFMNMGLQEKLEALKMELSKSDASDETLSPVLKEKVDRLLQEFKHNLSRPGSHMALKQKLETLSDITKLQDMRIKGEMLKKEINEKLQEKAKGQAEILRKARERVTKGEKLEEDQIKEVEKAREELQEMLKSVNLEVVGLTKKEMPVAVPALEEKLKKADELLKNEIEKAIDMSGLRWKIDALKEEISNGSDQEKVEQMEKEIREEIAALVDMEELKKKVEAVVNDNVGSLVEVPEQESVRASND